MGLPVDDSPAVTAVEVRRRMEDEYAQCIDRGLPATVLVLEPANLDALARAQAVSRTAVARSLFELLRRAFGDDLHAYPSGSRIVALLAEMPHADVESLCGTMIADATRLVVAGAAKPVRARLAIGLARTEGGRLHRFETLLLVAEEGAIVATHRDGGCAVHSMLYDLMERRAQRLLQDGAGAGIAAPDDGDAALASAPAPRPATEASGREAPPEVPVATPAEIRAGPERVPESPPPGPPAKPEEIDRLERRIAKLRAALAESEERVARLHAERLVDPGLPSSYRTVQGLSRSEQDYERKLSLLRDILEANLELRQRVGSGASPRVLDRHEPT